MPFNAPFEFVFAAHDLIYGLSHRRPELVLHFQAQIMATGWPATVDQYRKSSMVALRRVHRTKWGEFLRINEAHPRYGRYGQTIRRYDNDEMTFVELANATLQNAAWRAKSKFGMEWTIRHEGGNIHFLLDGIDMAAVVTKTHRVVNAQGAVIAEDMPRGKAQAGVEKVRTITHSELRWIYRNRANPDVQAHVQFWRTTAGHLAPCGPPWSDNVTQVTMPSGAQMTLAHAWRAYRPTTERNAWA